ncbi:MAG: hypothetical protein RSF81_04235 [Oscillospiraceae bacterium]
MMKKAVILMMAVSVAITLTGCSERKSIQTSDTISQSELSSSQTEKEMADVNTQYPVHCFQWVDNAETVAIEKDGIINYVGLDNNVKSSIEISPDFFPNDYNIIYGDSNLFILHQFNTTAAYQLNGEWQLYNASIHKRDGNLIKVFRKFNINSDNNEVMIDGEKADFTVDYNQYENLERVIWINDGTIALAGNKRLFFYEIATDKLILIDDFSKIVPQNKDGAYYGLKNVVPQGDGCLYFANDISGKFNLEGHIYYGDSNGGHIDFLNGEVFGNMFGEDGIAFTQTYTNSETGDIEKTEFIFNNENQSRGEIPPVNGWAFYHSAYKTKTGGRILFEGKPLPEKADTFYAFDIIDGGEGILSMYCPKIENMYQFELINVRGEIGNLEYIFSAMNKENIDNPQSYIYSEKTKKLTELEKYISLNISKLYSSTTHYTDFISDQSNAQHICIREIK